MNCNGSVQMLYLGLCEESSDILHKKVEPFDMIWGNKVSKNVMVKPKYIHLIKTCRAHHSKDQSWLRNYDWMQSIIYVFKGYLFVPVYNIFSIISWTHLKFKPKFDTKSQLTHCFWEKVNSGNYVVHFAPEVIGKTSNFWQIWGLFHKGSWSEWRCFH